MKHIIFGLIISVIYSLLILPRKSGVHPNIMITIPPVMYKGMFIIPISNKKAIHLHHWIIFIIIISLYNKYMFETVIGFCIGLIIQGLTYKDAFDIIIKNPYKNI